jgi:hypothetical protein
MCDCFVLDFIINFDVKWSRHRHLKTSKAALRGNFYKVISVNEQAKCMTYSS